jgi:16S rRNA (cytidine1402-2'-O)-methyltransferase
LTKLHEEFLRGSAGDVLAQLKERTNVRGEIVLIFAPAASQTADDTQPASIATVVAALMKSEGIAEMDALKRIARERGIGKSEAYRELQREQKRLR